VLGCGSQPVTCHDGASAGLELVLCVCVCVSHRRLVRICPDISSSVHIERHSLTEITRPCLCRLQTACRFKCAFSIAKKSIRLLCNSVCTKLLSQLSTTSLEITVQNSVLFAGALSECLSLEDEICGQALHFIRECLSYRSRLVNDIATCGICYGRFDSSLGNNALFRANKFKMNVCDIDCGTKVRCAIERYCERKVVEQQMQVVDFIRELLFIRDGR